MLLVIDISGSMGDPAATGLRETKLDLATAAAIRALDQFAPGDEVGLRVFTTGIQVPSGGGVTGRSDAWVELVAPAPISTGRADLEQAIESLFPQEGTPLYTATGDAYTDAAEALDPERINAVVVLSDGQNEDVNDDLDGLLDTLSEGREGSPFPVRVFTIAYGDGADLATLEEIAEATDAAVYDSADPTSIDKVFTAVISNF